MSVPFVVNKATGEYVIGTDPVKDLFPADPSSIVTETAEDPAIPVEENAPEAIIEMSICKCKTPCNTLRCTCKKAGLVCTEMCFCDSCENDNSSDGRSGDSESDFE